jgi:hypothetical protein
MSITKRTIWNQLNPILNSFQQTVKEQYNMMIQSF